MREKRELEPPSGGGNWPKKMPTTKAVGLTQAPFRGRRCELLLVKAAVTRAASFGIGRVFGVAQSLQGRLDFDVNTRVLDGRWNLSQREEKPSFVNTLNSKV